MPSRTISRPSVSARTHESLPFEQREFRNPEILSCEEIKHWIRELAYNPHWGWSQNKTNLGRALGFAEYSKASMLSKLRRGWIYPTEQVRLSERIRLIVNGYLIPNYNERPASYEYVNPPRPKAKPPGKFRVSIGSEGPMFHVEQFKAPTVEMPDFKSVFERARLWKQD